MERDVWQNDLANELGARRPCADVRCRPAPRHGTVVILSHHTGASCCGAPTFCPEAHWSRGDRESKWPAALRLMVYRVTNPKQISQYLLKNVTTIQNRPLPWRRPMHTVIGPHTYPPIGLI